MKRIIAIFLLTILSTNVFSQEFEVPSNYAFSVDADYTKYEADILKGIHWLTNTPIQEQAAKRKDVNAFVMKWITGSPNVSVEINSDVAKFTEANPDLLIIFMCGWTKYSLETKDYTNRNMGYLKGIEAVVDFYSKNKENLKKDKDVEKYVKMKEKGTLEKNLTK